MTWSLLDFTAPDSWISIARSVARRVVVFFWILSIIRVAKDASARTWSGLAQFLYIILVTIGWPIIGIPLYIAFRPSRYRPMYQSTQQHVAHAQCQHCDQLNDGSYSHCVFCGETLQIACRSCHDLYPSSYAYCYHCGAPTIDKNPPSE
jgi:RNA polymerase subunit RPABC4/transcription elongation factor Spt4